jgi:hypothetical protein
VRLLIETGLGAGVYSLGVKSVLYILPFLNSTEFLKSPQFNPKKLPPRGAQRGAETNSPRRGWGSSEVQRLAVCRAHTSLSTPSAGLLAAALSSAVAIARTRGDPRMARLGRRAMGTNVSVA